MDKYSIDTRPYWEALQQQKLVIQQCADCGICRHYPQPMCAHCHSTAVEWRTVAGSGAVHSWTITHQTAIPGFAGQVPYVFATVDLPEGVRMAAPLRQVPHAVLHIGLPVRLVFEKSADGSILPAFEAA
ncbi:Zn-ribbon domain-containing OB-fold protein [Undibacterium sp. TJN25]|uniref:Zn-ribbon domain-containing OB-fold protein n=1 Tax=Undibacterium sp. TJN25 TaxID=3413056 RepID=UPI003BEF7CDC